MNITVYKTKSPNESFNKSLSNAATYSNAELVRYDKERDTMTITVDRVIDVSFNYALVNDRYYFMSPAVDEYGFTSLELMIDPLMTYKSSILACNVEAVRADAETMANYYINDGFFVTDTGTHVEYRDTGFTPIGEVTAYLVTTGHA